LPRTKRSSRFLAPDWLAAIKTEFINAAVHNNSPALRELATEVVNGRKSVHQWACSWEVNGTWIEEWAETALADWNAGRSPQPGLDPTTGELRVDLPPAPQQSTEADHFSCIISGTPLARRAHRVTRGGSPWWKKGNNCAICGRDHSANATDDDRMIFRKLMHAELEHALDSYEARATQSGHSMEIVIPSDLDLKLTVAALSVLCGKTTKEIADHPKISKERSVVSRWLKEMRALLQLPPRKPGHRRRPLLQ
jgi:hypothetical protein